MGWGSGGGGIRSGSPVVGNAGFEVGSCGPFRAISESARAASALKTIENEDVPETAWCLQTSIDSGAVQGSRMVVEKQVLVKGARDQ